MVNPQLCWGYSKKFDFYERMDVSFLCEPPGFNRKETKMSIQDYERLNHTIWECKYHVVFIPKYRKKALFGALKRYIGPVFRQLASQKGCEILEGHIMNDHVHMLISIPPKYAVSAVVGYIKGKSAIYIARNFRGKERNFTGEKFWARGYCVSTVGRNETVIREYIKNQEEEDIRQGKLNLFNS